MAASASCHRFFTFKSDHINTKTRSRQYPGCGKLDGVATWLISGISTAFFASLEKCSCIGISTVEDADDVNNLPLISNDRRSDGVAASRRRTSKKSKGGP